jgi:alkylation response protein AidB-like acyl-CoA dehydrogenase
VRLQTVFRVYASEIFFHLFLQLLKHRLQSRFKHAKASLASMRVTRSAAHFGRSMFPGTPMSAKLSTTAAAVPERAEFLRRARDLVPALRRRGAQCEAERRIPAETMQDLRDAGLLRLTTPRRYGGYEQPWDLLCDCIMELAAGCGSTGWVYAVVGQHPLIANLFGNEAMSEIWADSPDSLMASSKRIQGGLRKVGGDFVANGMATFSSGCLHSDWIIIENLPMEGEAGEFSALVPVRNVAIQDTWQAMGMAGTGSHDIRFDDVVVPSHRLWHPGKAPSGGAIDAPMFRLPGRIVPFTLASVLVGIAAGAIDQFAASVKSRASRQGVRIAELQSLQMRVGESAAEVDAARTAMRAKLAQLMARLAEGESIAAMDHENTMLSAFAMQLSLRSVERIFYAGGAAELKLSGSLQRAFRDTVAGSRQFGHNWDVVRTRAGKNLFGLDGAD